jgi:hypothetical protein
MTGGWSLKRWRNMQANKGDLAAVVDILMQQSTICLVYTLQMTSRMPPQRKRTTTSHFKWLLQLLRLQLHLTY